MMMRLLLTAFLLTGALPVSYHAQTGSALDRWVPFPVSTVPFGVGERNHYKVTYGLLGSVGQSTLEIAAIDTIRGAPAYHINFRMEGGVPFAKVNDHFQSWLDVSKLHSHRFDQNVHEANYKRHRIIDFLPGEGVWQQRVGEKEESGDLATPLPLDDISFIYYIRTLPLEVGETYTLDRYYKGEGNPVVVKVLRREKVKLPAGEFQTIVVQPTIKTRGLFSEGGRAEVYFTDDEQRILVQLKTKLSIGTLNLQLLAYTPGTRLVTVPGMPSSEQ